MRVRFFTTVLAIACLVTSSVAFAQDDTQPQNGICDAVLSGANAHSRLIRVRQVQEFRIGGTGWARPYLTPENQTLIGIIDPAQQIHVFDVMTGQPVQSAQPRPFNSTFTRGEWAERDGKPVIHLGDTAGWLHHFGVGPQSSYFSQYVGYETPVFPLAVTAQGVLAGMPFWGRVRIMPSPPLAMEDQIEIKVQGFLRATHAMINGRDLFAMISPGMVSVIDPVANAETPQWSKPLLTNGANATLHWFRTKANEPALVVLDGGAASVYMPFTPQFETKTLPLIGVANAKARVHALTTDAGTFIVAPASDGTKVFRFINGTLQNWATLPLTVAHHLKAILLAPNQRVYLAYTEQFPGRRPRLNISKLHERVMTEPVYQYELEDHEVISDTHTMDLPDARQLLMVRTNLRVLSFEITPLPKN